MTRVYSTLTCGQLIREEDYHIQVKIAVAFYISFYILHLAHHNLNSVNQQTFTKKQKEETIATF